MGYLKKLIITTLFILLLTGSASAAFNISTDKTAYGADDVNITINVTGLTEFNEWIPNHLFNILVYCTTCDLIDDTYPTWIYPEIRTVDVPINLLWIPYLTMFTYNTSVGFIADGEGEVYRYCYAGNYTIDLIDTDIGYAGLGASVAQNTFSISVGSSDPRCGMVAGGVLEAELNQKPTDMSSSGDPGDRTSEILSSPWLWAGVILIFAAGVGLEEGGIFGGAIGLVVGLVIVFLKELLPLYAIFVLVVGLIAIYGFSRR